MASKFVYKYSLLPSLCSGVFAILEKMYYDFLWGDRRHRISKKIMIQNLENGGYKMVNNVFQENSLKLIWVEHLLSDEANSSFWVEHIKSIILVPVTDFVRFNVSPRQFPRFMRFMLSGKSLPHFWYDVFRILFKWTNVPAKAIDTCSYANQLPVCFNIAFGSYDMYRMYIVYCTLKLINVFTVHEFLSIPVSQCVRIKKDWDFLAKSIPAKLFEPDFGMDPVKFVELFKGALRPRDIVTIFRDIKSCRNEKAIARWSIELQFPQVSEIWKSLCLKASLLPNKKLASFHVEFLNRAFMLNNVRCKFSNVSPLCPSCNVDLDSFVHFFWKCQVAQNVWARIISLLEALASPDENDFTEANIMLSNFKSILIVTIVDFCKRYMYYCRLRDEAITHIGAFNALKQFRNTHYSKCKYLQKIPKHFVFWDILVNDNVFKDLLNT